MCIRDRCVTWFFIRDAVVRLQCCVSRGSSYEMLWSDYSAVCHVVLHTRCCGPTTVLCVTWFFIRDAVVRLLSWCAWCVNCRQRLMLTWWTGTSTSVTFTALLVGWSLHLYVSLSLSAYLFFTPGSLLSCILTLIFSRRISVVNLWTAELTS